jgi:2,4-dienoyl-CoA reductase-like NADH-dependent reductase (Old Yellow Enzyme family)
MKKVQKKLGISTIRTVDEMRNALARAHLDIPCAANARRLSRPIRLGSKVAPNSIAVQPCEGFDGLPDGSPSDLVFRRYKRYAAGGSGILWFESFAIADDGRCNPLQMIIKDSTLRGIKNLLDESTGTAVKAMGADHRPYNVVQLTHSGRRSVDADWNSVPLATVENPYLDSHNAIDGRAGKLTIASDEKIETLIEQFIKGAELSAKAGFDGVDIKVCHEYILRELLSSFTRPGKYGGSFENRTRAVFEIIDGIHKKIGNSIDICVRLNAYDCIPYPYGWGMIQKEGIMAPDLTEPIRLCNMLVERGVQLINLSTMEPRYQPYGTGCLAEFDDTSEIDPYRGTTTLLQATRDIKRAVPGGLFVATGLTWFEHFGAHIAAGCMEDGWFDIAGFGRQAMAYPSFAADIIRTGALDRTKSCITCDRCYDLIQKGHTITGCVMRDREIYLPVYREKVLAEKP